MHYKILLVLIVILLGAFFYLHTINTSEVTFILNKDYSYVVPVTYLVIAGFFLGVVLTVANSLVADMRRAVKDIKTHREKKKRDSSDSNYTEGVSEHYRGNLAHARNLFYKALDTSPGDGDIYMRIAKTHIAEGALDDAMKILEKGVVKVPGSVELLLELSSLTGKAGDLVRKEKNLREVLASDKTNPEALRMLRDLVIEQGDWDEGAGLQARLVETLKKGTDAAEDEGALLVGYLYEKALRSARGGSYNEATEALKDSLKLDSAFIPSHLLMGDVFYMEGNLSAAIRTWEKAYEKYPDPVFILKIEDIYMEQGKPEKILNDYKKAVEARPQDVDLRLLLSRLYLRLEMVDEATEELERIQDDMEVSRYQELLLAEAYHRRRQYEHASDMYRSAVGLEDELSPGFVCKECAVTFTQWVAWCSSCLRWGTLRIARTEVAPMHRAVEKSSNVSVI